MIVNKDKNKQKFRKIYDDNTQAVLRYCIRRTNTSDEAADIVSETFLIAWNKIESIPEGNEASYWLYGVARRVLANSYRKQANQQKLGDSLKQHLSQKETSSFDEASIDKLVVDDALAKLTDKERELITLANWEGLKSREIGKILNIPAVTVRTRLSRARNKLKKEFEKNGEHFPNTRH